jgi:hypothetical protein
LSPKDARKLLLWSEANDQACIVMLTPAFRVKHPDAIRSTVWRSDLQSFGSNDLELVDQNIASWNRIAGWLKLIEGVRKAA